MKDVIHGKLIRGAGILQPEGHDHILEQSYCPGYSERGLVYILWSHENMVLTGIPVHETHNLVTGSCVDQHLRDRHRVFVLQCSSVEVTEVHADSPSAIFLLHRYNT
jgi:hypothetical protein